MKWMRALLPEATELTETTAMQLSSKDLESIVDPETTAITPDLFLPSKHDET